MHHHRRKSGHTSGYTSMTDMRKAVTASDFSTYKKHSSRPATMPRRITPQSGSALKLGKSPRDREKELEDRWWDDEREAFPQYCMYCETQFLPSSDDQSLSLYCSDRCRYDDECSPSQLSTVFPSRSQTQQSHSAPDPLRDIIPRAAPSGGHFSPPTTPHTSAIPSLKSHLPNRPASPPSPAGTFNSHHWLGRSTQTSPGSSYAKATNYFPSTYDGVYYGVDHYGSSTDRPLSTRRPGVYSRPKSIELVTPMLGGR